MINHASTTTNAPHLELRRLPPPRVDIQSNESNISSNNRRRSNQQNELLRGPTALDEVSTAPSASPNRNLVFRNNNARGGNLQPINTHLIPQAAPYKLGQIADARDILRFRSIEQAHETLPRLPIGTPLFVKRSSREWTYARIVSYRRPDASVEDNNFGADDYWNEGKENFIVVVLNEDHSMRKFIGKNKWFTCVRLVRLGTSFDHDAGFVRHNSQLNQHQNVPILARSNSAPNDFATRSDHVEISVATSSAFHHSDVPLHSARMGSFTETQHYGKNSKSECHECDHSAVQSLSDCTASISEVRHCNENSKRGYPTFVLPRVAIGMPTEDDDAASVASTAAVERRSFQTEPNSHFRPAADLSSSMRFSPTADDIANSPASASSFSSSSPNESAIDLSQAKVNLNARHFCGKRRDRMRPMKRRQSIA